MILSPSRWLTQPPPLELGAGHSINFRASLDAIAAQAAPGKPIEIWFADEARIGNAHRIDLTGDSLRRTPPKSPTKD